MGSVVAWGGGGVRPGQTLSRGGGFGLLCALAVFGASVCCVYIFHFVSSDTFRVKKSPKRSPLSDPPSQVYRSLVIYDVIPHLGVKADAFLSPTSQQSVPFCSSWARPQHPPLASYMEDRPSVFARRHFDLCVLGEISVCPESRNMFRKNVSWTFLEESVGIVASPF